ncbi:hypothetical protein StoSoilB22_19100 [Arthrobacter sp. StoSoilB22]|nr:hypothetical protein StoSoilB22_19100 [Arthrobacter sp. StoSoilB22]
MAWEPPGDWVDAVLDVDATFAELVGEFSDRVLGLGDSHSVAGGDDDARVVGEHLRCSFGGDLAVLPLVRVPFPGGAAMPKPPAITEMTDRFTALHMM